MHLCMVRLSMLPGWLKNSAERINQKNTPILQGSFIQLIISISGMSRQAPIMPV